MKKIICLTGATGFLGKELINVLSNKFHIRICSRRTIQIPNVEVYIGDLTDVDFVKKFVKNVDIIVHSAAIINPFDKNIWSNVETTKNLLESKAKKFVYISSESVTYNLPDNYAQSKKKAEALVKKHKNHLILRPSVIFGKGDTRYISQFVKFVNLSPLIPVISGKMSKIHPVHVNDIAQIVLRGVTKDIKGVYSVVGSKPMSFKQLSQKISRIIRKERLYFVIPNVFLKPSVFFIKFINKRFASMLDNALVVRNTPMDETEKVFSYKFPSIDQRLRETILA